MCIYLESFSGSSTLIQARRLGLGGGPKQTAFIDEDSCEGKCQALQDCCDNNCGTFIECLVDDEYCEKEDVRRRLRMQDLALPIAAHLTMDLRWPMLMRERVSFWN